MEACSSAHDWARQLTRFGYTPRLISCRTILFPRRLIAPVTIPPSVSSCSSEINATEPKIDPDHPGAFLAIADSNQRWYPHPAGAHDHMLIQTLPVIKKILTDLLR